jgi:hypothetical protein
MPRGKKNDEPDRENGAAALIAEIRAGLDYAEAGMEAEFAENGPSSCYLDQIQALLEVREQLLSARGGLIRFEKLPPKSEAPRGK